MVEEVAEASRPAAVVWAAEAPVSWEAALDVSRRNPWFVFLFFFF